MGLCRCGMMSRIEMMIGGMIVSIMVELVI